MEGMHSFVKTVFLALMGSIVALILYLIFFGDKVKLFGVNTSGNWDGILHYMALAMEQPIAKYYYDNCYIPTAHENDGVDSALGFSIESDYSKTALSIGYDDTVIQYSNEITNGYTINSGVVQKYWLDTTKSGNGWY